MRMLLRSTRNGQFLTPVDTWTKRASTARDFRSVTQALEWVHEQGLEDMELVFTEVPAWIGSVPFEGLSLAQLLVEPGIPKEESPREDESDASPRLVCASSQ